jgi:hypothetical protein
MFSQQFLWASVAASAGVFVSCLGEGPNEKINLNASVSALNPANSSVTAAVLPSQTVPLVATTEADLSYTHAQKNTQLLQQALDGMKQGGTLNLPAGVFDIETVVIPAGAKNVTLNGAGIDATVLRRKSIYWDNSKQGDCPYFTEIFVAESVQNLLFQNLAIDGNSHRMGIKGYGTFDSYGQITSGTPQFPRYTKDTSSGAVIRIALSKGVRFLRVRVANGYRWAMNMGKVDGLEFLEGAIDTGNLSSDFKGHFDPAPRNGVQHAHTSQDGLHMINVSNAVIGYNDIHAEDSAIAVENNPGWDWGGFELTNQVRIHNNFISGGNPIEPSKVMTDPALYGTGLVSEYTGQGAVDIFYNESWDASGTTRFAGAEGARIRNITVEQNRMTRLRYGVRSGIFLGGGSFHAAHFNHRIYNLSVVNNNPSFLAGRHRNQQAGIFDISKAKIDSYNQTGGVGVMVHNTDMLLVDNNVIQNVSGGIGMSLVNTSRFSITNNHVDGISGTQVGNGSSVIYDGGESLRIWNAPKLAGDPFTRNTRFLAENSKVQFNRFGHSATPYKISVYNTEYVRFWLSENYSMTPGETLCKLVGTQSQWNNLAWRLENAWMDIGKCN